MLSLSQYLQAWNISLIIAMHREVARLRFLALVWYSLCIVSWKMLFIGSIRFKMWRMSPISTFKLTKGVNVSNTVRVQPN